jgi:hypothetical protein
MGKLAVLVIIYGMVCAGIALAGFPGWAAGGLAKVGKRFLSLKHSGAPGAQPAIRA